MPNGYPIYKRGCGEKVVAPVTVYKLSEEDRLSLLEKYGPPKSGFRRPLKIDLKGENSMKELVKEKSPDLEVEGKIKTGKKYLRRQTLQKRLQEGKTPEEIAKEFNYPLVGIERLITKLETSKPKDVVKETKPIKAELIIIKHPRLRVGRLEGNHNTYLFTEDSKAVSLCCDTGEIPGLTKVQVLELIEDLQDLVTYMMEEE